MNKACRIFSPPSSPASLHTFVSHLQRCFSLREAERLHSLLVTTGLHASPFAATALISLYSSLSLPFVSLSVFLSSPSAPSLPAQNALISAFSSNSLPSLALHHFRSLPRPDRFSFPCAIAACADLGAWADLSAIHARLFAPGLQQDVFVASALVRGYLRFGLVDNAEKVFDELPERDVVLWNAMVTGFAHLGEFSRSLEFFGKMLAKGMAPSRFTVTGVLSVFTAVGGLGCGRMIHGFALKAGYDTGIEVCNALIDLYGKCEDAVDAARVYDNMPERDIYSWNSMISAFERSGNHVSCLKLFAEMQRNGAHPDPVSVAAVLPACSQVAALAHGREIHAFMIISGMRILGEDVFVDNALMDMYGKSGSLEDARRVFEGMLRRDTASWNILIAAYAAHGLGQDALEIFHQMCESGVAPDQVTFVGVLSACSHAGLVAHGRKLLERMWPEFGVEPEMEHYVCTVDMLGRAGMLDEAREVAEMAEGTGGEAAAWRAYLSACIGEARRAEEAAEKVTGMEPSASGGWVLLANAYGRAGRFGEVAAVRGEMRDRSVRKTPGCSWVEIAGKGSQAFFTGDRRQPEAEAVYEVVDRLIGRLREFGYVPDAAMSGE